MEENQGNEIDVDALMDAIENPIDPNTPDPAAEQTPAPVQEYEIPHNGKIIKAPFDKVQKWASQGYNYSQEMAAFNKQKMDWESERKQYDPYKEVDTYARQNPQWWENVRSQFEKVQQGQPQTQGLSEDPNDPISSALAPIQTELQEFREWKNSLESSRVAYERQMEDQKLDEEISNIRKQYTDIPFDRVDEEGHTLEAKVLKHAVDNGMKSFKAAFHDYMAEDLQKRAEERGREAAVKARQEQARRGLLGKTQAPTQTGIKPVTNYRSKSYSDIEKETLAEFGIS